LLKGKNSRDRIKKHAVINPFRIQFKLDSEDD